MRDHVFEDIVLLLLLVSHVSFLVLFAYLLDGYHVGLQIGSFGKGELSENVRQVDLLIESSSFLSLSFHGICDVLDS